MKKYIDVQDYCENICRCAKDKCDKNKCPIWTAPAADVVEVKHGQWIQAAAYNDGILNTAYCSECKTYQRIGDWDFYPYCPFCGAKMNGERKADK